MNLIRNDEETLKAIINIQGNPNWERILWWIRESYNREMSQLGGPDNSFRSGMAAQLHDLLKNVHEARANMDAFTKAQFK